MTPLLVLMAETPSPTPAPTELELWEVSPGIEGFVWGFLLLAVLVIPLFLSMTKHMRRVDHNERLRVQAEEAAAQAAASDGAGHPGGVTLEHGAPPAGDPVRGIASTPDAVGGVDDGGRVRS
ncbi:hypothetical protein FE374_04290 [Georgenia yuyongxinii]|uniref:Uncharacterized protein n=1 Tax=Georgenia yuyongxinii TaxID=2589797 RepID=A0A5B8C7Q5_9MICO|nr:hypothetical protein [Georgenia yuyongxinii]QDC23956.1 hypothetical protein FE374_04290 [Georgenia yuyongxinii]